MLVLCACAHCLCDCVFGACVACTHVSRVLSPEMVRWAADSGRFVFLKDPMTNIDTLKAKIRAMQSVEGTPLK